MGSIGLLLAVVGVRLFLTGAAPAEAVCNAIPGVRNSFRGARGIVNRPFAGPGDPAKAEDLVELRRDPVCHPQMMRLHDDDLVTIVFTPPYGSRNAIVLTSGSDCQDILRNEGSRCGEDLGGGTLTCVAGSRSMLRVDPEEERLGFVFPDTGDPSVGPTPLAGPAIIAVTRRGEQLPCALSQQNPCPSDDPNSFDPLIACVDRLFADDGGCETPRQTFGNFTALPPANDYGALCLGDDDEADCVGEFAFTIDQTGNVLIPIDWTKVLKTLQAGPIPVARVLRTMFRVDALPGGRPLVIPSNSFLGSFAPNGARLAPIFDPQTAAQVSPFAVLFGVADGSAAARPVSVLRIARFGRDFGVCAGGEHDRLSCNPPACAGGDQDGVPCGDAAPCPSGRCVPECPGGACVPSPDCHTGDCALFDFSSRFTSGVGPVRISAGSCDQVGTDRMCTERGYFAPLSGMTETPDLYAFVVPEVENGEDLNGDHDESDDVLVLIDRRDGNLLRIGEGSAIGRAVARSHEPPFSFPAIAAEHGTVAILESERQQGSDVNEDGDFMDAVLRVFRLGVTPRIEELTPGVGQVTGPLRTVDAAPLVDGRSLAIVNGWLFFRTSEAAGTRRETAKISLGVGEVQANGSSGRSFYSAGTSASSDGRYVVFESDATNLVPATPNCSVFVRDRVLRTNECAGVGRQSTISGNGRFVAFADGAGTLSVFDRCVENGVAVPACSSKTELVNVGPVLDFGPVTFWYSWYPAISAGGGTIPFLSQSSFSPLDFQIYVRDRSVPATELATVGWLGEPGDFISLSAPTISADGTLVAFGSAARNLVPGDTNDRYDIFVRDREMKTTRRVSVGPDGAEADGESFDASFSADGRFVGFSSVASNLVGENGDANRSLIDVFVHDLQRETTELVSVATTGDASNGESRQPVLSADGRFVAFYSDGDNLVPGDTNGTSDIFVRDRLAGTTELVSVGVGGIGDQASGAPGWISPDGHTVTFDSFATNLVADDTNDASDVFVRAVNPSDAQRHDTMLEVLDTNRNPNGGPNPVAMLGPAGQVAIAAAPPPDPTVYAAFLGAETGGTVTALGGRVQLWSSRTLAVQDLHCVARAVALSSEWIAALVDESAPSNGDLNEDGDTDDLVVKVLEIPDPGLPAPQSCGEWINTQQAADVVAVAGSVVAFVTPERSQGRRLNHDDDQGDRVLQLLFADESGPGSLVNVGAATEEFVLGNRFVAFRTRERSQNDQSLNELGGDGLDSDIADDVLQIYDFERRCRFNTQQAVTRCDQDACDPHVPYRVGEGTVTFITSECDQRGPVVLGCPGGGTDMNGNGYAGDQVRQILNEKLAAKLACAAGTVPLAIGAETMGQMRSTISAQTIGVGDRRKVLTRVAVVGKGVCSDSGGACTGDASCGPGGTCFVPPGQCVTQLDQSCCVPCDPTVKPCCNPNDPDCQPNCSPARPCASGDRCEPALVSSSSGEGTCFHSEGECIVDADCDCPPGLDCRSVQCRARPGAASRPSQHVSHRGLGAQVFVSTAKPELAESHVLIVATAADGDHDEIADPFDNCPAVSNPLQEDDDGNGVGDACQMCAPAMRDDCGGPTPGRSHLRHVNRAKRDQIDWRWSSEDPIPLSDLASPAGAATYAFCLYDASAERQPVLALQAADGALRPLGSRGFRYKGKHAVSKLVLKGGAGRKGTIVVQAKGPAGMTLAPTVIAQLVNRSTGRCWAASFRSDRRPGGGFEGSSD